MKKETEKKILDLQKDVEVMRIDSFYKDIIRQRILDILTCEANDVRCAGIDLYKYTAQDEKNRPTISGIYYKNGKVYATDGHILCKLSKDYNPDNEGKIIWKDVTIVPGNYPNADRVIPNTEGWVTIPVNFDEIKQAKKMWNAHKKIHKKQAEGRVLLGIQELSITYIFMMADIMEELGIKEFLQHPTRNFAPLVAKNNDNTILMMPHYPHYEEWKEHASNEPNYLYIQL
jgi:hypothetical protein